MYLRTLKPIYDRDSYSKDLQKILQYELWIRFYKPLIDLLSPGVKENAIKNWEKFGAGEESVWYYQGERAIRKVKGIGGYSDSYQTMDANGHGIDAYSTLAEAKSAVKRRPKYNAKHSVLIQAFLSRKIYYADGFVYGVFSAPISRALRDLGGTFNNTKKAFKMALSQFPPDIRDALARGSMVEQEAIDKMLRKAQELTGQDIVIPGTEEQSKKTLADLHRQFEKVTPEDLEIPVALHDYKEEQMIRDYTANVHKSIEDLSAEMTYRLRQRVEDAVGQGMRASKLKQVLEAEFGVASNRSKLIARTETSFFVAKYREIRYEDSGITLYQWSTSHDERVRPLHKELNGQIFRWDDPPYINRNPDIKGNPGEIWNCRCVALPVIREGDNSKGINPLETSEHRGLHLQRS